MASVTKVTCCAMLWCVQGKGYVVGGHLANALLSITHQMASITLRDFMPGSLPAAPAAGAGLAGQGLWLSFVCLPPTRSLLEQPQ